MLDAVGYVVTSVPEVCSQRKDPKDNPDGIPTVFFGVFSTNGMRLGKIRYNYSADYVATPTNYIRMSFMPDNKVLFHPNLSSDPGKSMKLLEDVVVLMALAAKMDTVAMYGVPSLIPYYVVRDYNSDINQKINAAIIPILEKYGFKRWDANKDVYLYHKGRGESLEAYKLLREKQREAQLRYEEMNIISRIS